MRIGARFAAALIAFATTNAAAVEVEVYRIDRFGIGSEAQTFGSLRYLGGIGVTSRDRGFGGFSGVEVTDGGRRIVLLSDGADYLTAALRYDGDALTGLEDVAIESLLPSDRADEDGMDSEDLAFDPLDPKRGYVVRERRVPALYSFELLDGRPDRFVPIETGAPAALLTTNQGLESVAVAPPASPIAGAVVVILEAPPRSDPRYIPGWIVGRGAFSIRATQGYGISSARFLPDGDLLLLERRYAPAWGVGVRLRRVPGSDLVAGAVLDGSTMLEGGLSEQIDNMEGLAVHRDGAGQTILTLVSDDNYSILQRTLILQFALDED